MQAYKSGEGRKGTRRSLHLLDNQFEVASRDESNAMRTMGQGWMVVETIAYEGVGDPVLPRGKVEATFNEVKVAIKSEVRLINDHP